MALKPCRECGEKVGTKAKTCPHCGTPKPTKPQVNIGCWGLFIVALLIIMWAIGRAGSTGGGGLPETTPQTQRAGECIPTSGELLATIADRLTVDGGGTLSQGIAVRSGAHSNAYFVAAEIDGPGLEGPGDIGLWFTNSLEAGEGMILAVPNMATEFSDWPDASRTDAEATMFDPGAREAEECLRR